MLNGKLAGGLLVFSLAAWGQNACDQIKSLAFPDTVITSAEIVAAGPYKPPAQPGPEQPALNLPAHCRIAAVLKPSSDSEIGIEVWMPATDWNGKFQAVGNGGWAGVISFQAMALALQEGYATASTDTGHQGNGQDASFALGHPEKITDFSYRAVHEMTVKAKAMIIPTTAAPRACRIGTAAPPEAAKASWKPKNIPKTSTASSPAPPPTIRRTCTPGP